MPHGRPSSTATIAQALGGIAFPCRKEGLIEYARAHHADPAALDVLGGIPDVSYESMADVFKGVGLAHGHQEFGKPEKAGEPPRPVQPRRAGGQPIPTEEPEPATLEGQIEAARPHPTQLPPQPAPRRRPERSEDFLTAFRRWLGLG
ncbi:MAG: DUF2795 domain-containing protein [Pseudomonadota bacterium]